MGVDNPAWRGCAPGRSGTVVATMESSAVITLPPTPSSARRARHAVAEALHDRPAGVTDTAQLLATELVTNAVRHAGSPLTLRLECDEGAVLLAVSDESDALPRPHDPQPGELFGRGLVLVEALAADWGTEPGPVGGKTVWCVVEQ